MLYISFLSRSLNSQHTALYQLSALNLFIILDYDWDSNNKILKSNKTGVFCKSVMKNIICNIFRLIRACMYTTCLDLCRWESLSFMMLLLLKLILIFFALNTILFFYFPFSSDNKNDNNSIYLYLFKLEYQTDIFHCLI